MPRGIECACFDRRNAIPELVFQYERTVRSSEWATWPTFISVHEIGEEVKILYKLLEIGTSGYFVIFCADCKFATAGGDIKDHLEVVKCFE